MDKQPRGAYAKYPREDLEKAIEAAKNGQSIRSLATQYNIPRKTLGDYVSGRSTLERRPGRERTLPNDVEDSIIEKVVSAAESGFPITKRQFLEKVGAVAKKLKLKTPFKNGVPGKDFWYELKKRHPELTIRTPQNCASNRLSMMTRPVINRYFDHLDDVMEQLGLKDKPQQVWNCDETGLQFCPDAAKVVAKKGSKNLVARCSPSKESITTMVCINAAGKSMPPLCVVKGKTRRSLFSFATSDAPVGTYWTVQENAWMNDAIGISWFEEVFLRHCGEARPQLLILDSHHSHEVLDLLEMAREENISIFALPPHTTHMLQPLDRVVFKPFKERYRQVCTDFMSQNPGRIINKVTWPSLLKDAWDGTMRPELLKKGFEATGIFPVDRARIPDSAFAPAETLAAIATAPSSTLDVTPDQLSIPEETPAPRRPIRNETSDIPEETPAPSSIQDETPAPSSGSTQEPTTLELDHDVTFLNDLVITVDGEDVDVGSLINNTLAADWRAEVDAVFGLQVAPPETTKRRPRAILGDRLLTSDAIIEEKRQEKEKKQREEDAKKERQERTRKRKTEKELEKSKKGKK